MIGITFQSNQIKSTQFWESQFVLNLTVRQGHLILLLIKALAHKVMTSTCILHLTTFLTTFQQFSHLRS